MSYLGLVLRLCPILIAGTLAAGQTQTKPVDVDYCTLAKNRGSFNGKRVRVRALYRYAFEVQSLEAPDCCPGTPPMWAVLSAVMDDKSEKLYRKFPKGEGLVLAIFVGDFETGDAYGMGGSKSQLKVDTIESVEKRWRFADRTKSPAWVPKNCN